MTPPLIREEGILEDVATQVALFSIHPEFVEQMRAGRKRYEFRRVGPRRLDLQLSLIYATAPVQAIVARFATAGIYRDTPHQIWHRCGEYAGIERDRFFSYFAGATSAVAIEIAAFFPIEPAIDPYEHDPCFRPPQSFLYLDYSSPLVAPVLERGTGGPLGLDHWLHAAT